ncbi:hypothetical protein [Yinghuangia sp. YIM S10712]|uniref:hypothetical protein n=1 Tax=Yinghuangia sp. YIM S10712 TaxID=3436930 RepID=UPI003F52F114
MVGVGTGRGKRTQEVDSLLSRCLGLLTVSHLQQDRAVIRQGPGKADGFVSVITDVVAMMQQHIAANAEHDDSTGEPSAGGVNAAAQLMNQVSEMPMVAARIEEALAQVDVAGTCRRGEGVTHLVDGERG